jgi:hypothetical protein
MSNSPVDLTHTGVRIPDRMMRFAVAILALGLAVLLWKQMNLQDSMRDLQMRMDDDLCLQRHRGTQRLDPPGGGNTGSGYTGRTHPGLGAERPWVGVVGRRGRGVRHGGGGGDRGGGGSGGGGGGGRPQRAEPDETETEPDEAVCTDKAQPDHDSEGPAVGDQPHGLWVHRASIATWATSGRANSPTGPQFRDAGVAHELALLGDEEPPRLVELTTAAALAAAPVAATSATSPSDGLGEEEDEELPPLEEVGSPGSHRPGGGGDSPPPGPPGV